MQMSEKIRQNWSLKVASWNKRFWQRKVILKFLYPGPTVIVIGANTRSTKVNTTNPKKSKHEKKQDKKKDSKKGKITKLQIESWESEDDGINLNTLRADKQLKSRVIQQLKKFGLGSDLSESSPSGDSSSLDSSSDERESDRTRVDRLEMCYY